MYPKHEVNLIAACYNYNGNIMVVQYCLIIINIKQQCD